MKHHEVVLDFNRRGMVELFRRLIGRKKDTFCADAGYEYTKV